MLLAAAFLLFQLVAAQLSSVSVPAQEFVSCPCGSTGKIYRFLNIQLLKREEACQTWTRCLECQDKVDYCLKCPEGFSGSTCSQSETSLCQDPGFINGGNRMRSDGSSAKHGEEFREGDLLIFSCRGRDSALEGPSIITCTKDGIWSDELPSCVHIGGSCPDPGSVANADRINTDGMSYIPGSTYRPGQSVVFTCHSGFSMQGTSRLTCQESGTWSQENPLCLSVEDLRLITKTTKRPYETFACQDPGFVPEGNRIRSDGSSADRREEFREGEMLIFSCIEKDYALEGPSMIMCTKDGKWSDELPKCVLFGVSCPDPGVVSDANRINTGGEASLPGTTYLPGQSVMFICHSGFSIIGTDKLTCKESGTWSRMKPFCLRAESPRPRTTTTKIPWTRNTVMKSCSDPGIPINGFRSILRPRNPPQGLTEFPRGSHLTYSCKEGFLLEGWNSLVCLSGGKWSSPLPICSEALKSPGYVLKNCSNPGPILNGRAHGILSLEERRRNSSASHTVEDEEFPEETVLLYTCDKGYAMRGEERAITCRDTGSWSSEPPICVENCGQLDEKMVLDIKSHEQNAVSGEWPWMVGVAPLPHGSPVIGCGGVLLNNRTILSSATCFLSSNSVRLLFGKYRYNFKDDDDQVIERTNITVKIHPNFDLRSKRANIALVSFSPSLNFSERILPVCLPTNETTHKINDNEHSGYVTTWGLTEDLKTPDSLQMSRHRVVSAQLCLNDYERNNLKLNNEAETFCSELTEGRSNECYGDDGSPMVFFNRRSDRYFLEGLVSLGQSSSCGRRGRYAVFTKVLPYVPWIKKNTS